MPRNSARRVLLASISRFFNMASVFPFIFHVIRFPQPLSFPSLLTSLLSVRSLLSEQPQPTCSSAYVPKRLTMHSSRPRKPHLQRRLSHLISFESCRLGIASAMPRHKFPTVSALHSCITSEAKGTEATQFPFSSLSSRKAGNDFAFGLRLPLQ